jgi:hypothetical protein
MIISRTELCSAAAAVLIPSDLEYMTSNGRELASVRPSSQSEELRTQARACHASRTL